MARQPRHLYILVEAVLKKGRGLFGIHSKEVYE